MCTCLHKFIELKGHRNRSMFQNSTRAIPEKGISIFRCMSSCEVAIMLISSGYELIHGGLSVYLAILSGGVVDGFCIV